MLTVIIYFLNVCLVSWFSNLCHTWLKCDKERNERRLRASGNMEETIWQAPKGDIEIGYWD